MRSKVQRLCRHFGIRLGKAKSVEGFRWSWDGERLDIRSRYDGHMGHRPDSDSIHDIAHWLLCSEKRKLLPEFGLGPGVDNHSRMCDRAVTYHYAAMEETLASLLGILMEKAAGMCWESTWNRHGWNDESAETLLEANRRLEPWLAKRGHNLGEILEACK